MDPTKPRKALSMVLAFASALLIVWAGFNCDSQSPTVQDSGLDSGIKTCTSSAQCKPTEVCRNKVCVPAGTCSNAGECDGGECQNGKCVTPQTDGSIETDGETDGAINPLDGSNPGDGGNPSDGGNDSCSENKDCDPGYRCNILTSGCEAAAIISVDPPDYLDFGAVAYGEEKILPVTITNKGKLPLAITGFEIQNPVDNSCFRIVSGDTTGTLQPDQYQVVQLAYKQNGSYADAGKFRVASNDKDKGIYALNLRSSYKGLPKFAIVDPDNLDKLYPLPGDMYDYTVDFGFVAQGSVKHLVVTMRNVTDGDAILSLNDLTAQNTPINKFTVTFRDGIDPAASNILPTPSNSDMATRLYLARDEMVYMHVDYDSKNKADSDGQDYNLVTNDNDINASGNKGFNTLTFKFLARSTTSKIEVTPLSMDFKEQQKGTTTKKTVTISNKGDSDLNILAASGLKNSTDTFFWLNPASLEKTIPGHGTFTVEVNFSPTKVSSETNYLYIDSDDKDLPHIEVNLTGTGTDPTLLVATTPVAAGNPPTMDFGKVLKGSTTTGTISVTNSGFGNLVLNSILLSQGATTYYKFIDMKLNGNSITLPVTLKEQSADTLTYTIELIPLVNGTIPASMKFDNSDAKHKDYTIYMTSIAQNNKGESCQNWDECSTGYCADGVCCLSACNKACELCNMTNYKGDCRPVTTGPDPKGFCKASSPMNCGQTGNCLGSDQCEIWPNNTVCAGASCTTNNTRLKLPQYCNGQGYCLDSSEVSCSPYVCNPALQPPACKAMCFSELDCSPGFSCDANGQCKLANAQACQNGSQCASGNCADGVCCNDKCDKACERCNLANSMGQCAAVELNQGDTRCVAQDKTTCGTDGLCTGTRGVCQKWDSNTICKAAECSLDRTTSSSSKKCDGQGGCQPATQTLCAPYVCDLQSGICKNLCTGNLDCASNALCDIPVGQTTGVCRLVEGQTCKTGADCMSTFCADGVCCNESCDRSCERCDQSPGAGTCTAVLANQPDPKGKCLYEQKPTCGYDSLCSGTRGICQKWGSNAMCSAAKCSTDSLRLKQPQYCMGNGTCQAAVEVSCSPYVCDSTLSIQACKTQCTSSLDCSPGYGCDTLSGKCKLASGQQCQNGNECVSGFCVDGYCCTDKCDKACEKCNLANLVGICSAVGSGLPDPKGICPALDKTGCKTDGLCTGARGTCHYWDSGTVCVPGSCLGDTLFLADTCNGTGSCTDNGSRSCVPYTCSVDGGAHCFSACNTSGTSQCATGYSCDTVNQICLKIDGQKCTSDNECLLGFCTDGVCCGERCDQACEMCNLENSVGTCTAIGFGLPDPRSICPALDVTTCATDGLCTGAKGTCHLWAAGETCLQASCNGDLRNIPHSCNGIGGCLEAGTQNCAPYTCNAGDCLASCGSDQDCATGYSCDINSKVCKKNDSVGCSNDNECYHGFCTDGVCCNERCDLACEKCNLDNNVGACTAIDAGQTDPRQLCAVTSQSGCKTDGKCSGTKGVCELWLPGTICVTASCTGDRANLADTCDGLGACNDNGIQNCIPYTCRNGACLGACNSSLDCAANYACDTVNHVCRKVNGQGCGNGGECLYGFCTDGVCCNEACNLQCEKCNLPNYTGTCTAIELGVADPRGICPALDQSSCKTDGLCSGIIGVCKMWDQGTICSPAYCSGDTAFLADTCNGSGGCNDNGSLSCVPYTCSSGSCLSSCNSNLDCAASYSCDTINHICKKVDGQVCSVDTDCYHGFCTDGVCCSERCNLACEKCDLDGKVGTCTAIAVGLSDPRSICVAKGQDTCDTDGKCTGNKGECEKWASGTVCVQASCSGDLVELAHTCNGNGGCVDNGTLNCTPSTCSGGICKTTCNSNGDCATGYSCNLQLHQCLKNDGLSCSGDTECYHGFCTDGVCCSERCTLACEKCNLPGYIGTCTAIASGQSDPRSLCATTAENTCGTDGKCTGTKGVCEKWAPGTVCVAASCSGDTAILADTCDGQGGCQDKGTQICTPYTCGNGVCKTSCNTTGDCAANYVCDTINHTCKKAGGQGCSAGTECYTGFCSDNVCCDEACTLACEKCNLPSYIGTCTAVASGQLDPRSICSSMPSTSCGTDGKCTGTKGICEKWASGTVCVTASCSGDTAVLADTCNGNGTCTDNGTQNCVPYTCSSGACKTSCNATGDCAANYTCDTVNHVCRKDNGQGCSAGTECYTGFCSDNVCCSEACTLACEKCNLPGYIGTCTAIASGQPDPRAICTANAESTCGTDGKCSGTKGVCEKWASGTVCIAASCGGDILTKADTCNGNGGCVDNGTQSCTPYTCSTSGGAHCLASCNTTGDCAANYTCDTINHVCKKSGGQGCTVGTECYSGFCSDNVCCDEACTLACEKCNLLSHVGTCTAISAGEPDPRSICSATAQNTCGLDGMCSGAKGVCEKWASGTVCVDASCSGDVLTKADTCNGNGGCVDNGTQSCTPYTCSTSGGAHCLASCNTTGDCAANYTCDTINHVCKKSGGQGCTVGAECYSGFCSDNVCCESACGGVCEKCNQDGRLGYCDAVASGSDPDGECAVQDVLTCGTTGLCSGIRSCQLYLVGTVCLAATCSGNTSNLAHACNGTGTCLEGGTQSCLPYICNTVTGLCLTQCSTNNDCQTGYSCNASHQCKKNNGQTCSNGTDCLSGFCADTVCCESACGSTCEKCNQFGRLGYCDPVPVNTDPDSECSWTDPSTCTTTGACSGNRSCQLYPIGTVCVGAICTGNTSNLAHTCNGNGSCSEGGTQACLPYVCNSATGLCLTQCTTSIDCQANYSCDTVNHICKKVDGQQCGGNTECYSGNCCSGYCRNLQTDDSNCGSCGTVCQQVNVSSNHCSAGVCNPVCSGLYKSCDSNPANGCERAINTLTDCGDCNVACSRANATATCSTGTCQISSCNAGYDNCDSNNTNGCEVGHAGAANSCGSPEDLGSKCADRACGMFCPSSSWSTLKVKTGNTSRWFKARASECSDCLTDLHHRVTISSPAGIVYNVCLYRPCGSLIGCTASSMEITAGDSWGGDNSFDYYIEVKYISGSSCSNWSLTVEGTSC